MPYHLALNSAIQPFEVPALRESIGWGGRPQDYPQLFERCNFYADIRETTTKQLVAFGYVCGMGLEHGYLEDIMVHPAHQGKGLGKQLIHALITESKQRGLGILTLSTDEETAAFYQKCGFDLEISGVMYLD
ncbi:GNAT family N-acetyltransferase [Enterococcus songbeiensis]|uniref:GNAT family N-acetyltransferase n=1 Tax=Enterococcus songbeiensis TaxID=2559927 RepID=UPI0010F9AE19|nr:GNAT family N-acetyltransferase [Enterococcus songbeiensis]